MDAYQQQQHRFMRPPPPPSTADPYHHQQHHQHQQQQQQQQPPPPPPRPPVPPQGHWYSSQFQYSPSPPPPPQQPQWAPPPPPPHPHSDHYPPPGSYPPPQHHYPAHPAHPNHFPPAPPQQHPLRPHFAPPPPPQSYPQEWGTPNWGHHQSWDYQAHSNGEDWAARARAWADAKAAAENQHLQSQFVPAGRVEEQSHYHDQYPHSADTHYTEIQHQSLPASSYQQVPGSAAPLHWPPAMHPSEVPSVGYDASSYGPEGHLHTVRDGTPAPDSNAMIQSQGNPPKSPSVHQQEVPSSYSSATGNNGGADQSEHSYRLLPQEGQHHVQPPSAMPLADQPLDFAPRFNRDDPRIQSSYPYLDSVGPIRGMDTVASMNSWTASVVPGVSYPPVPPVLPSGPQHDPALAGPSPAIGHGAPPFSSFPGPGLQPTIASAGPPFALVAGTALHPSTAFSSDGYGIPSASERPKKAPVPNWLKEEIKKTVITSSSLDHPKEGTQSIEDEVGDKSVGEGDQEDSKSIDSSRSAEEDDDEDYAEAARTAAINQEIKRVLTEVLLKVTDELFDEIATKVLDEDDPTVEVDKSTVTSNHRVSPSPPTVTTPKATAKILIPGKSKESETEGAAEKSSSSTPGDVLGLANYATDDEDDEEIQSSRSPISRKRDVLQHPNHEKPLEDRHDVDANGSSLVQPEEISRNHKKLESEPSKASSIESKYTNTDAVKDLQLNRKNESHVGGSTLDGKSKDNVGIGRSDLLKDDDLEITSSKDNDQSKETKIRGDKNDRHENKRSAGKDQKEAEIGKSRTDEKGNGNHRRHDERHSRKEKTDELNGSKDRRKDQSAKSSEKEQESESRKRSSHADVKEDKRETERHHRAGAKEESSRKRGHNEDKDDDRSRQKHASDSGRHKRRRSSSISRGRNGKDDSAHRDYDSSDEASNDSKRKSRSRRRNLSPSLSPVKSRRRQVSRSPHSKHSQRRHSPYSSLDNKRGRKSRSRSRTPVRRHR